MSGNFLRLRGRPAGIPFYNHWDLVVYGANPGGVIAAVEARSWGLKVLIVGGWRETVVGGMLGPGGLGWTDFKNIEAFGEDSRSRQAIFQMRVASGIATGRNFVPKYGILTFQQMLDQYEIPVRFGLGVDTVSMTGQTINSLTTVDGLTVSGSVFVDATYEGDLLAKAGVSYVVGREAADIDNPMNGYRGVSTDYDAANSNVQASLGATLLNIDPFVTPGVPGSGLISGVVYPPALAVGDADPEVQAFNFRMTLTEDSLTTPGTAFPSTPPAGYTTARYEVALRHLKAMTDLGATYGGGYTIGKFITLNNIGPGVVYDCNNAGFFSTDYALGNSGYIEGDYATREAIWQDHENYHLGLFYMFQHDPDPRVPADLRARFLDIKLASDHTQFGQLYVRQGRRMVSDFVITAADITAPDGSAMRSAKPIAAGSYTLDSHVVRYMADDSTGPWRIWKEGRFFVEGGDVDEIFPIAYEAIVPAVGECDNLLVTFAVSATHAAFSAIRMEYASMAIGQAAGAAAALMVRDSVTSHAVNYPELAARLVAGGQYIPAVN